MAYTLTMPEVGETVTEGTIEKWLKQPGDKIEKYEPIVEINTDKVNVELPSPVTGTLVEHLAQGRRDRSHRRAALHDRRSRGRDAGGHCAAEAERKQAAAAAPCHAPSPPARRSRRQPATVATATASRTAPPRASAKSPRSSASTWRMVTGTGPARPRRRGGRARVRAAEGAGGDSGRRAAAAAPRTPAQRPAQTTRPSR